MKSNFYFLEHTIFFPFIFIFLFIFIAFFNLLDVLNFQKSTSCFIFVFFSTVPIAMYLIFLILEKNLISFSGRGVLGTFAFILSFYFILQDDCIFYFFENSEKNYSFNEFLLLYLKFFTHIFNSGLIVICSIASIILLPEIIVSLLFSSVCSQNFPSYFLRVIVLTFIFSIACESILNMLLEKGIYLD